jgi:maleate cis-trans isomerase
MATLAVRGGHMSFAVEPRYRWGFVGPTEARGAEQQGLRPEPLLPPDVVEVSVGLNISDYTPEGVEEAIQGRYWTCVDDLVTRKAQSINLGGVPISSQLGRPRVLQLLEETERRTGLTADSTNEAIIAALLRLGVDRVAVASRWAEQLNTALTEYFAHAGVTVAAITCEGQWARDSFAMSIEKGIVLAFRLGREAMRQAPQAGALLLPGGTWRSLAAVPILEEDFAIPVITNTTATVWRLIRGGIAPPVQGWGRLLENP